MGTASCNQNTNLLCVYVFTDVFDLLAEAGRAGRDGLPAKCILLYSPSDVLRVASIAVDDLELQADGSTRPKVLQLSSLLLLLLLLCCIASLCNEDYA